LHLKLRQHRESLTQVVRALAISGLSEREVVDKDESGRWHHPTP
jgi:hypothetical protein